MALRPVFTLGSVTTGGNVLALATPEGAVTFSLTLAAAGPFIPTLKTSAVVAPAPAAAVAAAADIFAVVAVLLLTVAEMGHLH